MDGHAGEAWGELLVGEEWLARSATGRAGFSKAGNAGAVDRGKLLLGSVAGVGIDCRVLPNSGAAMFQNRWLILKG